MNMKTCSKCGITKSITEFTKLSRAADGFSGRCKECVNGARIAGRRARGVQPKSKAWNEEGRICNDCKEFLPWSAFGKNSRSSTGYNYRCKSCISVRGKKYRDNPFNRNIRYEYTKAWKRDHLEMVSQYEAKRRAAVSYMVTERDLDGLLRRQNGLCPGCSALLTELHLDHIIPLVRGGTHGIGNLQYLCPTCNMRKGRSTMTEWKKKEVMGKTW